MFRSKNLPLKATGGQALRNATEDHDLRHARDPLAEACRHHALHFGQGALHITCSASEGRLADGQ